MYTVILDGTREWEDMRGNGPSRASSQIVHEPYQIGLLSHPI